MVTLTDERQDSRTRRLRGEVKLDGDHLVFGFPQVHTDAEFTLDFRRTLRIPDDGRQHYLPPGLGAFPLELVDDYPSRVPDAWQEHGGVFFPMHQAEAMWISFLGEYPMAVKVAAGNVNALTADPWTVDLSDDPQNYLVVPDQPWLDGFCIKRGLIRQFVAMPLGQGYTAEEQLHDVAGHGGVQITVYPMKASEYEKRMEAPGTADVAFCKAPAPADMGLAPGGLMRQEIYEDDYGFEAWETSAGASCFVGILNSLQYSAVTGVSPPQRPPTARQYSHAGLPWFDYYDADRVALAGAEKLEGLESLAVRRARRGRVVRQEGPLGPVVVKPLSPK